MGRVAPILLNSEGRGEHHLVTAPQSPSPFGGPSEASQDLTLTEGLYGSASSSVEGPVLSGFRCS